MNISKIQDGGFRKLDYKLLDNFVICGSILMTFKEIVLGESSLLVETLV